MELKMNIYSCHPSVVLNPDNKTIRSHFFRFALLLTLVCMALPIASSVAAESDSINPTGKMVLLPFTIQTDTPQEYLQAGLTNILATRMTNRTGLIAIQATNTTSQLTAFLQTGDQQAFKQTLKKMGGNYLIIGSLEQQNSDYEIMIYVFSRDKNAPASFARTITTLDQAIPAMDELSIDIAEKVFNRQRPEPQVATDQSAGISGFQTAHPDRAFREGLYQPATILGLDNNEYKVLSTRRSRKMSAPIKAMDVADLDGDGTEEIVILEKGNLVIYRFKADHFQHVTDHPIPDYLGVHAINIADIDNNGLQEIYVSANSGNKPSSQVYEWDGATFKTLHKNVPYYLRPGLTATGDTILLAQTGSNEAIVGSSFYQMQRDDNGKLVESDKVNIPKGFNLFDFIRVDLENSGTLNIIGLSKKNRLIVFDPAGKAIWKSEDIYGASKDFLGTISSNRIGKQTYMHTRLIAEDQDGDGIPEIIVGRNRLTSVKYFNRLRYFEGSSISALKWEDSEMTTLWETRKIPAYTTDYQVTRKNNQQGQIQLFFIESDSSYPFFFWESAESVIHLYEMGRESDKIEAMK